MVSGSIVWGRKMAEVESILREAHTKMWEGLDAVGLVVCRFYEDPNDPDNPFRMVLKFRDDDEED